MASVFTRIIRGDLPSHMVWADSRCVAFLSVSPLTEGHTLVVPRDEVDHWLDLPADLIAHLTAVSHAVGRALAHAYRPPRVGLMIAGFEVPHTHLHVLPIGTLADLEFANARPAQPERLAAAARRIREALRSLGHGEHVAAEPAVRDATAGA